MQRRQSGFTLVEIAIVLVVIGLLLGGVLKGQELIASSRVRNLADQQAGIQSAFYGFQDRYRAVPGDMPSDAADDALGVTGSTGGDGNGKIDNSTGWEEANAVWEHLSKSGFIKGNYDGAGDTTSTAETSPTNVFNGVIVFARDTAYEDSDSGTPPERLVIHMGGNVPADVARELDVKLDDGAPKSGILRNSATSGSTYSDLGHSATGCTTTGTATTDAIWDVDRNVQDCNPAYLF